MPSSAALLLLFAFVGHGLAVLVNHTIDDEHGDSLTGVQPIYSPPDKWVQGATCTSCNAAPNPSLAFDHTWHDSTYFNNSGQERSVTLTFTGAFTLMVFDHTDVSHFCYRAGSAIYVYFITVPNIPTLYPETHLNITLDGQHVDVFNYAPQANDVYHYNQSVYSNSDLLSGPHTI
jgi:hypothetical protein